MNLGSRNCWVFDLDGTLTVAVHDFDAIRRELGLVSGQPILEQLAAMTPEEAAPRRRRLHDIELGLILLTRAQDGAAQLLTALRDRNVRLGILTRNTKENAIETLESCGLGEFFDAPNVFGRDCCEPKPSGDGIAQLLAMWDAAPGDGVMVGDYVFDLVAGRDAGVATVLLGNTDREEFTRYADVAVAGLAEVTALLGL